MGLLQAVILGLIQGLTEYLPISSSGHLYLVPALTGWADPGAGFSAVIQLGTMLAVVIYFWQDIVNTMKGWTKGFRGGDAAKTPESRLGWAVAIGTLPVVVFGLAFQHSIENTFRSPYVVASTLILLALVLGAAELVGKRKRGLETITAKNGLVVGLWQALALVPGSSRSGCTITGALFSGFDRPTAARFSFLLSIPAVVLSGLYELYKQRHDLLGPGMLVPTIVATLVSFATGYLAIKFLMAYLKKRTTLVFIVYRVVLGLVVLFLAFGGRFDNLPVEAARPVPATVAAR